MADAKTRVRFLRAKKYPHPSGQRRAVGETLPLEPDLAERWAERGIVEIVKSHGSDSERVSLVGTSLADLPGALSGLSDRKAIEQAAAADDRKGAAPLYEARLAELGD